MIKLDVKVKEEDRRHYSISSSKELDLKVTSFKKLFKGTIEVPLDEKLQSSLKDGYVTLRGFERILVGTGVIPNVPEGYVIKIIDKTANSLKKGFMVSQASIGSSYKGELGVVITNNTPFLNRINIGDIVAQAILSEINDIEINVE